MKKIVAILFICSFSIIILKANHPNSPFPKTGVSFQCSDSLLQQLYNIANKKLEINLIQFTPTMKVLVEGGGYENAWIETQPMGGEMYAKRDIQVALNNQLIFIEGQRADGRMPGMVISTEKSLKMEGNIKTPEGMQWMSKPQLISDFNMFQGYCFPEPAWKMYFWIGKDKEYLKKLYEALEKHDAFLWRTRDSNGDGLLETWCVWDTGEDNSTRLISRNAPTCWPFDFPPTSILMPDPQIKENFKTYWKEHDLQKLPAPTREEIMVPFASMDVMSYSFDGRMTLSKISHELENGLESYWLEKADEVRETMITDLWDSTHNAFFDKDKNGKQLEELIHNNLRTMYHGAMTQTMADKFVKNHLLNTNEFWTSFPLPSIAKNESLFCSDSNNNWSGQPQGLTYQRAIRALENYGYYEEITTLGNILFKIIEKSDWKFTQQFDPELAKPASPKQDAYGPTILSVLEYISRMHGIYIDITSNQIWWSTCDNLDFTYTQRLGEKEWKLNSKNGNFTAILNGKTLLTCNTGVRIVSDFNGNILKLIGISSCSKSIIINSKNKSNLFTISPNKVIFINANMQK